LNRFQVRKSFAQVTPKSHSWRVGLSMRVFAGYVHHFPIKCADDIDAEFISWLAEASAVGEQRHLKTP